MQLASKASAAKMARFFMNCPSPDAFDHFPQLLVHLHGYLFEGRIVDGPSSPHQGHDYVSAHSLGHAQPDHQHREGLKVAGTLEGSGINGLKPGLGDEI